MLGTVVSLTKAAVGIRSCSRYNVGAMQKVDHTFIIHWQVKCIPGGSYETEVTLK